MARLAAVVGVLALLLAPSPVARAAPSHPASMFSTARAAAVVARVDGRGGGIFQTGTGFAIADGVVATAAHLTGGSVLLVTRCDGREVEAAEVLRSDRADVALLTIDAAPMLTAPLAPTDPPAGVSVVVPGFPNGGPLTMVRGVVAGYLDIGDGPMLLVDPTPVPGQSGSPVLDRQGQVVGLLVGVEEISGHGLAVPVSELRAAIGALVAPRAGRLASALLAPATALQIDRRLLPLLALDTGTARTRAAFLPRHPLCPR